MDYGFAFLSAVDIHKDVAVAERKGFTHAWLYDTQMICADVFQCLALCAAKTKKIKLGTNVTNPLSRIAPVTEQLIMCFIAEKVLDLPASY